MAVTLGQFRQSKLIVAADVAMNVIRAVVQTDEHRGMRSDTQRHPLNG